MSSIWAPSRYGKFPRLILLQEGTLLGFFLSPGCVVASPIQVPTGNSQGDLLWGVDVQPGTKGPVPTAISRRGFLLVSLSVLSSWQVDQGRAFLPLCSQKAPFPGPSKVQKIYAKFSGSLVALESWGPLIWLGVRESPAYWLLHQEQTCPPHSSTLI